MEESKRSGDQPGMLEALLLIIGALSIFLLPREIGLSVFFIAFIAIIVISIMKGSKREKIIENTAEELGYKLISDSPLSIIGTTYVKNIQGSTAELNLKIGSGSFVKLTYPNSTTARFGTVYKRFGLSSNKISLPEGKDKNGAKLQEITIDDQIVIIVSIPASQTYEVLPEVIGYMERSLVWITKSLEKNPNKIPSA